jgi:release factor glutamine methyltransferase
MTYKEAEYIFKRELSQLYPVTEVGAMFQVIFMHLFGFTRMQLYENGSSVIPDKFESQIYNIIHQLKQFKPIQYILGETEFYGLRFLVDESVLIPRPETEELVHWILSDIKSVQSPSVIDLCTGSGCIAVALAKNIHGAKVSAVDISQTAIDKATENARINETIVNYQTDDILNPQIEMYGEYDVIVSNPPYVTEDQKMEMHSNVLDYEPHIALFTPVNNSFIFYEAIARFAKRRLKRNGTLYFEINEKYHEETAHCITKMGFTTELKRDINNKYRMIKAWHHG